MALHGLESGVQRTFQYAMGNLAAQGVAMLVRQMRTLYDETRTLSTEFESQMAILSTAVDPTVASFEELHSMALLVGEDTRLVGIDASQSADAMTTLFKNGMEVNEVFGDMQGYMEGTVELGGVLRASIDLQAASALDLAASSDAVSVALKTYNMEAEDANAITNDFVQTADASVAEVEDLVAAMKNVGPTAAAFNWDLRTTNNALAVLSTRGIAGAEAGTALKSMLNAMIRDTDKVQEAWADLNVELYDAQGNMRAFPDILGDLEGALAGMTQEQRDYYVLTLAGSYGQKAMNTLLAEGRAGWDAMADATRDANSAAEIAAVRTDTLAGAQESLDGALETLKIRIGEELNPLWRENIERMTALVEEHGPAVVEAFGDIADSIAVMMDFMDRHPALTKTATEMGGLAVATWAGHRAFVKFNPLITGLPTALSNATVGIKAYKQGALAAKVSTLGWTAALGPLVAGLAAVGTTLVAVNKSVELHKQVAEETAEATDEWTEFLAAQSEEVESATELAEAYAAQQQEVAEVYEASANSGKLLERFAAAFIDKQEVMTADSQALNEQLAQAADSYSDYRKAVARVNQAVEEGSWYIGRYGQRMQDTSYITENSLTALGQHEFALARTREAHHETFATLGLMKQGMQMVGEQAIEAGQQTSGAAGQMAGAAGEASAELRAQIEAAWKSFGSIVETAVGEAIAAYKSGNEELYAEQQQSLAEMLWTQTDTMQGMGQITGDQAMQMKSAIAEEFGIVVNETQIATTEMLTMFDDWAQGGETAARDIVGFIQDIGPASQDLVEQERVDTQASIDSWERRQIENKMAQTRILEDWEEMKGQAQTTSGTVREDFDQMAGGIEEDAGRIIPKISSISDAIEELPTQKMITIDVEYNAPPEVQFNSPEFAMYYALERTVKLAKRNPIPVGVQADMAGLQAQAQALAILRNASSAPISAGGSRGPQASPAAGAPGGAKIEMTNYVRDELDIELLARRTAEYIRARR